MFLQAMLQTLACVGSAVYSSFMGVRSYLGVIPCLGIFLPIWQAAWRLRLDLQCSVLSEGCLLHGSVGVNRPPYWDLALLLLTALLHDTLQLVHSLLLPS